MKRKKLFKILLFFIILELLVIVGIKGYGIIRDIVIKAALSEKSETFSSVQEEKEEEENKKEPSKSKKSKKKYKPYKPKTEFMSVDTSYFDDALFIGDSRTVALRAYGTLTNSHFFAKTGISVNALFDYPATDELTGLSLRHILSERSYKKIYIMIGVNDLSSGTLTGFTDGYFETVDKIREYQPNAVIYIQSIIGITAGKEYTSAGHFDNQTVINRNALLKSKCDGESLVYLDLFSAFSDEAGYLKSEYSADGLHIKPDYTYIWEDYLKSHAIKINE